MPLALPLPSATSGPAHSDKGLRVSPSSSILQPNPSSLTVSGPVPPPPVATSEDGFHAWRPIKYALLHSEESLPPLPFILGSFLPSSTAPPTQPKRSYVAAAKPLAHTQPAPTLANNPQSALLFKQDLSRPTTPPTFNPSSTSLLLPPPQHTSAASKKITSIRETVKRGKPACYRCGDRGHYVSSCRNSLVCFTCNRIGH